MSSRGRFIWDPVAGQIVARYAYRKRQAVRAETACFAIKVPRHVERGRFAFRNGEWVKIGDAERVMMRGAGIQIIRDIDPYHSILTREVIGGRRQHRDHLRAHGCIEVGNDPMRPHAQILDRQGLRDDLMRAWEQGMTPEAFAASQKANAALRE